MRQQSIDPKDHLENQWKNSPKPSPASTLAPEAERSHGNYRMTPATSGNGCGSFGVVAIAEIEEKSTAALRTNNPVFSFRQLLQPRMAQLQQAYQALYSPYDLRDLYMPDMNKVDEKVFRECLPNYALLVNDTIARRDAAEKKEADQKAWQESPEGRVTIAYARFRAVRFCVQVRKGYMMKYVNDTELDRANVAIHAIVDNAKQDKPGINTDALWNNSANMIKNFYAGIDVCQHELNELYRMSPVAVYDNTKPE